MMNQTSRREGEASCRHVQRRKEKPLGHTQAESDWSENCSAPQSFPPKGSPVEGMAGNSAW